MCFCASDLPGQGHLHPELDVTMGAQAEKAYPLPKEAMCVKKKACSPNLTGCPALKGLEYQRREEQQERLAKPLQTDHP